MAVDPEDPQALRRSAADVLDAAWRPPGFTCPNPTTYPWLWLWDSCFHSVVWAELGRSDRAIAELRSVFGHQSPTGFVPHMTYVGAPGTGEAFWGRPDTSSITQPPMFGHAVAELVRRGVEVPADVLAAARSGLMFLLEHRRRSPAGIVQIVHPWESGADDSPRWDDVVGVPWTVAAWRERKGTLLGSIVRNADGDPIGNPDFAVGAVAFHALVAFNAVELGGILGDPVLVAAAADLVAALDGRWDPALRTWVDDGPTARSSGRVRTLEALLGLLVTRREDAVRAVSADLVDPSAFGAPFGPTGVHRAEPCFAPDRYWRGSAWPQLTYLLAVAARRAGAADVAAGLGAALRSGATRSGWAEHWDPDTAAAGGAVPQSWTTLAVVAP